MSLSAPARMAIEGPDLAPHAAGSVHITLRDVAQTYPPRAGHPAVEALSAIDFDFRHGEFVSVVGPSGCGKTTLLEIIAGLATPTRGVVAVNGEPITGRV